MALRTTHAWRIVAAIVTIGLVGTNGAGLARDGTQPAAADLPALEPFLNEVRAKLRSDEELQLQYTFQETVTERERDGKGRLKKTTVKVYEVFPADEIGYRRLVRENGRAVPDAILAREDAKQRAKVEKFVRDRQRESPEARARRLDKRRRERQKDEQAVDELFRIMRGVLVGRELVDGQAALVLAFTPRPGVKTTTTAGRVFKNIEGRAWFTEADHELIKVDLRFIDTVSFGWGLLARVHEGASASVERTRLADGAWLPSRYQFAGSARVMLVRGLRVDTDVEFSGYRKATGSTSETFDVPRRPR